MATRSATVLRGTAGGHGQKRRERKQERDRLEIRDRIERQGLQPRRDRVHAAERHHQGVAVGRSLQKLARRRRCRRRRVSFDDDALAEAGADEFAIEPRHHVDGAAGRQSEQQRDRLGRKILCRRAHAREQDRELPAQSATIRSSSHSSNVANDYTA